MSYFFPPNVELFPISMTATVIQKVSQESRGRVRFQAVLWPAKLYQADLVANIDPGQSVTVVGRVGNTLLVIPSQG